jgi:hypothetical protein
VETSQVVNAALLNPRRGRRLLEPGPMHLAPASVDPEHRTTRLRFRHGGDAGCAIHASGARPEAFQTDTQAQIGSPLWGW